MDGFQGAAMRPPVVLSIAGSDPSGGAGIQADTKTVSALGGYAATAITAVTVQNTRGVTAVEYLPAALVAAQIDAVLDDLHPDAVKIGMTGTAAIVRSVADALRGYGSPCVVLDPVAVSTSGRALIEEEALTALCDEVFPLCRLVTPNLNEAEQLLGHPVTTVEEMEQGAEELFRRYGCAFLVKGGHLAGDRMTDVLCDGVISRFDSPRIATGNLHGTGCTLSSAIATGLASGRTLREAVGQGKAYMDRAIAAARDLHIGSGNGPLWHFPDRR